MLKYAQVVDEQTKQCNVGLGTNTAFYKSIGMAELDVEQGADGNWYLQGYAPKQSLDELKKQKLTQAGSEFAKRRDCIRWVDGYGFDCTIEDITNFMAAFTPLLVAKSGNVLYKVWLDEQTKGIADLSYTQMQEAYDTVRNSQMSAYAWYEDIKAQIMACTTAEEIEYITW